MLEEAFQLRRSGVTISDEGDTVLKPVLALGDAVTCYIYEPQHDCRPQTNGHGARLEEVKKTPASNLLVKPIVETVNASEEKNESNRVWRVLPSHPHPGIPPRLLGNLVHEALKLWHFPTHAGDQAYHGWMAARVRQFGVVDTRLVERVAGKAIELLRRFQQDELYRSISEANRRLHEVPFTIRDEDEVHSRRIDLMFQNAEGWHLVDFKSDRITTRNELDRRLRDTYEPQLSDYARAVEKLLDVRPYCLLCMLDYQDQIRVIPMNRTGTGRYA